MYRVIFIVIGICAGFVFTTEGLYVFDQLVNGGNIAPAKQFPQFASFRMLDLPIQHFCSGNILNTKWIMTTAVCINERTNITRIVLVLGAVRMDDYGYRYAVDKVVRHPNFTGRRNDFLAHNLALVKTTKRIEFNRYVAPVALFTEDIEANHKAMVAGWKNRQASDRLRYLMVKTIGNRKCREEIPGFQQSYILNATVCTENKPQQGMSHGDFGSGLISSKLRQLIGIASVVMLGVQDGRPDIFIKVAPYARWIHEVING